MIQLCEEDYIIIEKGRFVCKFKPPIDKIETEIMQLGEFDFKEENVENREAFENDRQKIRDFLSLCVVEVRYTRENKVRRVFKDNSGLNRIPFAVLMSFFYAYINEYNLTIGELKN